MHALFSLVLFALFLISFLLNLKEIQRSVTKNSHLHFTILFILPIFVLMSPCGLLTFIVFKLYKKIVYLILNFKFGSTFLGFFQNQDGLHVNNLEGDCTINVLLVIESLKNRHAENKIFQTIYNLIDEVIVKNGRKLPKFCSTRHNFMGYVYMREKCDIDTSECVKKMKVIENCSEIKRKELIQLLSDYSTVPLPYNNTLMWDVIVGMQPLNWKTDCKNNCYPVLFRFHHSVADGVNIFEFISGIFGYNSNNNYFNSHKKEEKHEVYVKDIVNWFSIFFFMPAIMYSLLMIKDTFSINSKFELKSKKCLLALYIEESKRYLQKINDLRRKYDTTFTSVLAAAFTASLRYYYIKREESVPEYVTSVVPFHPKALSMRTLLPGSKTLDDIDFCNGHNVMFPVLPISPKYLERNGNPSDRLDLVTEFINVECNSHLQKVTNSYMNLYNTLAPLPVTRLFAKYVNFGPSISNVPASPKIKFACDHLLVTDYIFLVPDVTLFSFSMYITSYDERLQIALTAPTSKCTAKDIDLVLNKFLEYINVL